MYITDTLSNIRYTRHMTETKNPHKSKNTTHKSKMMSNTDFTKHQRDPVIKRGGVRSH